MGNDLAMDVQPTFYLVLAKLHCCFDVSFSQRSFRSCCAGSVRLSHLPNFLIYNKVTVTRPTHCAASCTGFAEGFTVRFVSTWAVTTFFGILPLFKWNP